MVNENSSSLFSAFENFYYCNLILQNFDYFLNFTNRKLFINDVVINIYLFFTIRDINSGLTCPIETVLRFKADCIFIGSLSNSNNLLLLIFFPTLNTFLLSNFTLFINLLKRGQFLLIKVFILNIFD